jgi:hypothetical protein
LVVHILRPPMRAALARTPILQPLDSSGLVEHN